MATVWLAERKGRVVVGDSGFRFPTTPGVWGTGIGKSGLRGGEEVSVRGAEHAILGDERGECVGDGGSAQADGGADGLHGEWRIGGRESGFDAVDGCWWWGLGGCGHEALGLIGV
jgi:hypothetical protein